MNKKLKCLHKWFWSIFDGGGGGGGDDDDDDDDADDNKDDCSGGWCRHRQWRRNDDDDYDVDDIDNDDDDIDDNYNARNWVYLSLYVNDQKLTLYHELNTWGNILESNENRRRNECVLCSTFQHAIY